MHGGRTLANLQRFLDATRKRIAQGAYALDGPALKPNGSFAAALRGHQTPVIAELKPRSPSEGRLLDRPAAEVLAAYQQGHAAALSVLADADHFDGSPELVRQAHVTGLPILFKDFVIDEAQVRCAAHNGASAVLLIERAFRGQPQRREALVAAAHAAGLEVLLELFDAADWASARSSKADLLGVNARDLDTLHVDEAGALRLVAEVAKVRSVVALSGIADRAAHRRARQAGACAVLVGTSLLRSPDPALALRALQRPLAKACGLRTAEDVAAAAAAGADLVGLVVGSPDSPRLVAPLHAQRLAQQARDAGMRTVLVTRATDWVLVLEWSRLVRPDFVQLHGLAPTAELRHRLANLPTRVLAAVAPGASVPADCDGVVLDATAAGGAGTTHAWAKAPAGFTLVAGGLDAGNAAQALAASGAWGADASSRLESSPGVKDHAKLRAFVQAVHAA